MRRQGLTALVLLPLLALGASACGNGNAAGGTAGATRAAATSDGDKMREFAKCMRANGIDMPDPSEDDGRIKIQRRNSGGKNGEQKAKAAEAKCRHLMPNGGKPTKPNAQEMAKLREFAKCMRENGVPDFPDPNPDGGSVIKKRESGRHETGVKGGPDDPVFRAAEKKCRPKGARAPGLKRSGK